jgi:quercetin dioxygenase-like cupin family protein
MAPAIGPAAGGSVIRIIHFPPRSRGGLRSPMHRTRTIDYGIVLEGEMVLILTDSEVELKTGDVVIQRGTDHAWENRSDAEARMAFILIDAAFGAELAPLISKEITP